MDFTVEFYETGTGKCPVREFLDELKASDPDDFVAEKDEENNSYPPAGSPSPQPSTVTASPSPTPITIY